jgi:tetratricopeptide (TPR) repeat protein
VLDHYLHTAMQAYVRFTPHRPPLDLPPPLPGVIPVCLDDSAQALAWYESEAPGMIVLISYAYEHGYDAHAWRLAWTLTQYFRRRGRLQDWGASQRVALAAAERLGDRQGMAHSYYQLGHVEDTLGDCEASELHLRQALATFSELEDPANEAVVLNGLAFNLGQRCRCEEALPLASRGVEIVNAIGFRALQAALEETMGQLYSATGDYSNALAHCELAQALHRDCGNHAGLADTLVTVGHIYQRCEQFRHAIEMYQDSGDLFGEADSLIAMGDSLALDRYPDAQQPWLDAAAILERLSHPLARQVRAKLAGTTAVPASRADQWRRPH